MRNLVLEEMITIAGGSNDDNLTNPEKVDEIVQDGKDEVQQTIDDAIDKIHDAVHKNHTVKALRS